VLVVGDMLELGPRAVELHTRAGEELAGAGVDLLVGVGELGRYIAAGAARGGKVATEQIKSVQEACLAVPALINRGDVVLVKGSRGMGMEQLVEPIRLAFAPAKRSTRAGRKRGAKHTC